MAERQKLRDYRLEATRFNTFQNWPVKFINPMDMVTAGFYFIGSGDVVRCFECQIYIYNWEKGDNPLYIHQRWSPRCRFLKKIPCKNVLLNDNPNSIATYTPRDIDVCGYSLETPNSESTNPYCLEYMNYPRYPEYATPYARYLSFKTWSDDKIPSKLALIEAGFYYTGKDDITICYYCGGGLGKWEEFENPWEQHAKWFNRCVFVKMMKGQDFIKKELAKLDPDINQITQQTKTIMVTENPKKVRPHSSDDQNLCKICFINDVGASFEPCGHLMSCYTCAIQLLNCTVCRQSVINVVRVILS